MSNWVRHGPVEEPESWETTPGQLGVGYVGTVFEGGALPVPLKRAPGFTSPDWPPPKTRQKRRRRPKK